MASSLRLKAVILAAGLGTRLAPLTTSVPKILVPLGGRPLLLHQLSYLARNGVSHVAVNVHHHAEQVLGFLDQNELPVDVRVSHEPQLLGTAGALDPLRDFLAEPEPFVVLYGDVVTDVALADLRRTHEGAGATATLGYYRSDSVEGKGILVVDEGCRVSGFLEKPTTSNGSGCVNAGIYVVSPDVLSFAHPGADFGHDVWPALIAAGELVCGHEIDGYLRDIGSPEALAAAEEDLVRGLLRW